MWDTLWPLSLKGHEVNGLKVVPFEGSNSSRRLNRSMSDDPYDFEIELPTSNTKSSYGSSSKKSKAKNSKYQDSDDDLSGLSDSNEDKQEDQEASYDYYSSNKKKKEEVKPKPTTKANTTTTGVSALDKAKSFLSKYSTKPVDSSSTKEKPATSSRVSRLELSLDDEDLSIDLSDSEDNKKKKKKESTTSKLIETSASRTQSKKEEESEEENKPWETKASTGNTRRDSSPLKESGYSSFDEEEEEAPKSTAIKYMEESMSAAELDTPSVANTTSYSTRPTTTTTTTATSSYFSSSKLKTTDVEKDNEEVDEVDSSSDFARSGEIEEKKPFESSKPSVAASTTPVCHDSIMSDHGHYDDEFEEESLHGSSSEEIAKETPPVVEQKQPVSNIKTSAPAPAAIEPTVVQPVATSVQSSISVPVNDSRRNSTFDYSMDFSDESESHRKTNDAPSSTAILESEEEYTQDPVPAVPATHTASSVAYGASATSKPAAVSSTPVTTATFVPPSPVEVDTPVVQSSSTQPKQQQKQTAPVESATPRARVVIVREYENSSAYGKPEMKDASTQFTGNHAAIQTELVPDGMQNILLPQPTDTSSVPLPPVQQQQPQPQQPQQPLQSQSYQPAQPSSIPVYPYSSRTMPSMPAPPMFGMSSYQEQLMILQHQIQQKRAEAQRVFRERTTFKGYSSLQDTEMFLASNRPRKLELWEALQRVDPTLDEVKAKEVARVAATTSTGMSNVSGTTTSS